MCLNQPQPKSNFANSCKINNKNNTYTKKNVQGAMCFDQPQPKSNFDNFPVNSTTEIAKYTNMLKLQLFY